MGRVEVWIGLNAVTIVATFLLALINWTRLAAVRAKRRLPASEELRLLREHNLACAQDDYYLNVFILALGVAMVVWAMTWDDGEVPGGIIWGTGAFTLGWVLWSIRGWQSWRRLDGITRAVEVSDERTRAATGR